MAAEHTSRSFDELCRMRDTRRVLDKYGEGISGETYLLSGFASKVVPRGEWDLKEYLKKGIYSWFNADIPDGDYTWHVSIPGNPLDRVVFYDVWGNIMFGMQAYVLGIPEDFSVWASGLSVSGNGVDVGDDFSIHIGYELGPVFEKQGYITASQIDAKVRLYSDDPRWTKGVDPKVFVPYVKK